MPDSCCAVGCKNRRKTGDKRSFYKIPAESKPEKRKEWINAIKRDNWSTIKNAKVCSDHFVKSEKSNDPNSLSYTPTIFNHKPATDDQLHQNVGRWERQQRRSQMSAQKSEMPQAVPELTTVTEEEEPFDIDMKITENEIDVHQDELYKLKNRLKNVERKLKKAKSIIFRKNASTKQKFGFNLLKKSKDKFNFYTGINVDIFLWILSIVEFPSVTRLISINDQLLIVLMKLKIGYYNKDLAYRFDVKPELVSKIYRALLPVLAASLQEWIVWPGKDALNKNLPKSFKSYRKAVCIIDCTEIFIQRPFNLNVRAQTWSNYKHNNTIKYLIAVAPYGAVTYISNGWGGRVSDKQITNECGFLDLVETGDVVLADRGFTIEEELATRGATLKIPEFTKRKSQLSAREVDTSRKLANVRIHVERVIGRMRKFDILNRSIPISQVNLLDEVMVVVAALVNFNMGIV